MVILVQVAIVPDEVAAIAAEVRAASHALDTVITTGGVGVTVDDVTMAAVADAFGYHLTRCHGSGQKSHSHTPKQSS